MLLRKYIVPSLLFFFANELFAQQAIDTSHIAGAEKMYDVRFNGAQKDSMLNGLEDNLGSFRYLHQNSLPNNSPYTLFFDPVLPGMHFDKKQIPLKWNIPANVSLPANKTELAFYSIPQLASLLKNKKISSVALTKFFIERLKKFGDTLHCVIAVTEDIAMKQAANADANFAKGIYKSPLQGIPYGIKDLFSVKGTKTTWGAPPYKDQQFEGTAFVAQQLENAGAVLIAKLSLGELAMDDVWFGGKTRNPWNISTGSGGSSAGSGSATAAGLVVFAIGTETFGSIVDPSTKCGVTGLRPTFGSVARTGGMTLAWSSDKIGPLCKSAEDAAIVFAYIHGSDGVDVSARDMPFNYSGKIDVQNLKVGYVQNYIDTLPANSPEKQTLATLRKLGVNVVPFEFPHHLHASSLLGMIITVEGAAAFDELTRSKKDDQLVQQNKDRWPNVFRTARFVPAVEYVNACRMRYMIMQKMDSIFKQYDIIIAPPEIGDQMGATNMSGNPSITIPVGFSKDGMPVCISFIGRLFDEGRLVALAKIFQDDTDFNKQHPAMFK
jgi:Asp-tRNA(Asn)/Glu-tRNA(Gln) amidotransferase A subunit family amidase